jgi:hypothetical protein
VKQFTFAGGLWRYASSQPDCSQGSRGDHEYAADGILVVQVRCLRTVPGEILEPAGLPRTRQHPARTIAEAIIARASRSRSSLPGYSGWPISFLK